MVNYALTSASAKVFHITISNDSNFKCNGKFILYSNGNYSLKKVNKNYNKLIHNKVVMRISRYNKVVMRIFRQLSQLPQ